jgi:hypothetical protein
MRRALTEALRRNGYTDRRPSLPKVAREMIIPGLGRCQWWAASSVNGQHWYVTVDRIAVRVNFRHGDAVSWSVQGDPNGYASTPITRTGRAA